MVRMVHLGNPSGIIRYQKRVFLGGSRVVIVLVNTAQSSQCFFFLIDQSSIVAP